MAKRGNSIVAWILLLLLLAGLGAGGWWWMRNRFEVRGIDISHYQGEIDWSAMSQANIDFVFIKATEGTTIVDEKFEANRDGALGANIPHGAYHFFRATMDGKAQAQHFLKHADYEKGDLPPVLDLEETDGATAGTIRREALEWCQIVEQEWGVKPLVYTLPHFAGSYLDGQLHRYPLWVADLGWLPWPRSCKGWAKWTFWQNSHHGKVDGIKGDVDLNVFNGSKVELGLLRKK